MLSLLGGVVLIPVIIASIGAAEYGVWIVLSTMAVFFYNSDLGIGTAVVHFSSQGRASAARWSVDRVVSVGLVWMTVITIIVVPIYILAASIFLNVTEPDISSSSQRDLMLLGAVAMAGLFLRAFSSALIGTGYYSYERRNQAVGVLIRILGTLLACFTFETIQAVAIAEVAALLIPPALSLFSLVRNRLFSWRFDRSSGELVRVMLAYSIRVFGVNGVGALIMQAGSVIVGFILPAESVTFYNFAFRIYAGLRQIISWITDPLRPALSRLFSDDRLLATRLLAVAVTWIPIVCFSAGLLICTTASVAVPYIFDDLIVANQVVACIWVLIIGLFVNSFHLAFVPAVDGIGSPGVFFKLQIVWCFFYVLIAIPLTGVLGIFGAALALSLTIFVIEPWYIRKSLVVLDYSFSQWVGWAIRPVFPIIFASSAILLVWWLISYLADKQWIFVILPIVCLFAIGLPLLMFRKRLPLSELKKSMSSAL